LAVVGTPSLFKVSQERNMTESPLSDMRYRAITAQAWTGMLVIPIAGRITEFWQLALQGSQPQAYPDTPLFGIWFFTIATCASVLLLVGMHADDSAAFRRLVFFASGAYLAVLLIIQFIDRAVGLPWSGFHMVLVITHDILAFWACWASKRWLHLAQAAGGSESSPSRPPRPNPVDDERRL
jgi:hypothetical protein